MIKISQTRKDQHISEILYIDTYKNDIQSFNALFTDIITFFRDTAPVSGGNYSVIEIAREYLGVMSAMVWRLSVLTFEVGQTQAPELVVFKQNVTVLLNNVNKLEEKVRALVRAEKIWNIYYKGSVKRDEKDRPIPTKSELYWTTVIKNGLDKIYFDTNNLIHTAISLGSIYKVRLALFDDMKMKPAAYQPKFISTADAEEHQKTSIRQAIGKSEVL